MKNSMSVFLCLFLAIPFATQAKSVQSTPTQALEKLQFFQNRALRAKLKDQVRTQCQRASRCIFNFIRSSRGSSAYRNARRELYFNLHYKNGTITDVYCQENYRVRRGRMPNSNQLNCEHTWPKSRYRRYASNRRVYNQMLTDLHHLFPSNSRANSIRSNNPFGYASRGISGCQSSKSGGGVFLPPANHRGNVARALFYMATVYEMNLSDIGSVRMFLEWHRQDPVDREERTRNEKIYQYQGTRNPYIDNPSYANQVFSGF